MGAQVGSFRLTFQLRRSSLEEGQCEAERRICAESPGSHSQANRFQIKHELGRLDNVYLDRFVTAIHHVESGPTLAVVFDDGSVSFLDQVSMQNLALPQDLGTVSSMPQAGFSFPLGASGRSSCRLYALLRNAN